MQTRVLQTRVLAPSLPPMISSGGIILSPSETYSELELRKPCGRVEERIEVPEEDRDSTRKSTESTNLDLWVYHRLNHQLKIKHWLDLGPAYM